FEQEFMEMVRNGVGASAAQPDSSPSAAELLTGIGERAWRLIVHLARCQPAVKPAWGPLAHGQPTTPQAEEGKDLPLPEALRQQLPWLRRLQIIMTGPGRQDATTRRYRAEAEVAEAAKNMSGALRIALLQDNGTTKEKVVTITATHWLAPF